MIISKVQGKIKSELQKKYVIYPWNLFKRHYYIIRRQPPGAGFFSNFLYVVGQMEYALNKNYIPVVDMENYKTLYNEKTVIEGTLNAWEYYFSQPCQVSLGEAYASRNYILSNYMIYEKYMPCKEEQGFEVNQELLARIAVDIKEHIHIKKAIMDRIEKFVREKFVGNVLGVHIRQTDSKVFNPGHKIGADKQKYLEAIQKLVQEEPIDTIFVATDEEGILEILKERYGNRVISTNAYRGEKGTTEGIHLSENTEKAREYHKYHLGEEVIEDMLLLSKADYFVFGRSNVATTAMIFNNNQYKRWMTVDF